MYAMSQFDVNFGQNWRNGQIVGKPIRVVDLKELALLYDLEDWLDEVVIPFKIKEEADFVLATSPLRSVFYFALVSVIREHGIDYKDRFFNQGKFITFEQLYQSTLSGRSKKVHLLDSLQDLVLFAYRRCWVYFKEDLDHLTTNKECFHYFRMVFSAVYEMIKVGRGKQFSGHIHAKALLTQLLKPDVQGVMRRYIN